MTPVARLVRRWLVPVGIVLLAVGVLWAAGGLRTVQGAQGRSVAAEQPIDLARWTLVVHRIELVDGGAYDIKAPPVARLHLRATFTGEASAYGMGPTLLTVQGRDGAAGIEESPMTGGPRTGNFDPYVSRELTLDFRWPDPPTPAPAALRVLVRNEAEAENYLFPTEWSVGPTPVAHVDLPCPDRRSRR